MPREKARWELHKDATCCFEQILEAAPLKTATDLPSCKPSEWDEQYMLVNACEVRTYSIVTFSQGLLHMDSSVKTLDAINRIYQEWCPIELDGERESRESILLAQLDDYDDDNQQNTPYLIVTEVLQFCFLNANEDGDIGQWIFALDKFRVVVVPLMFLWTMCLVG